MMESMVDKVLRKIGETCYLYHRLILIVGPARSGKTSVIQKVSRNTSAALVNVFILWYKPMSNWRIVAWN
jgi:GTPase SAR1 family protein